MIPSISIMAYGSQSTFYYSFTNNTFFTGIRFEPEVLLSPQGFLFKGVSLY